MFIVYMGENVIIFSALLEWDGDHFKLFIFLTDVFVLIVYPSKEPGIKSHLAKYRCLWTWVPKRI